MPKRAANELSDAEKHYIDLVAQRTDEDATTLFFTNTKEFNRLLRAALGVPTAQEEEDFKTSELCFFSNRQSFVRVLVYCSS